jgi:SH3 domain protein
LSRIPPASNTFLWLILLLLIVADPIPGRTSLAADPGQAGEGYVSNLTITVRRGPGVDYKIIAFLHPGDEVEVLGREAGWSQVGFGQTKTGWVLERFLTDKVSLLSQKETFLSENQRLKTAVSDLTGLNASIKTSLDKPGSPRTGPVMAKSHPPRDLSQALALAKHLLKEEKVKVRYLQEQKVIEEDLAKWFLIGSGMSGIGMVLGVLTYRSRRWFRFKI